MNRRLITIIAIVWMIVVVGCASSAITLTYTNASAAEGTYSDKYARLDEIMNLIKDNYYEEVDENELIENAIRGMFLGLDEYSYYYSSEEMADMLEESEGRYYGIGVLVTACEDGALIITRVFAGPAREAGLLAGDRIIAVDGERLNVTTYKDMTDATDKIKSDTVERVTLTIDRAGEEFDIDMPRANVEAERVRYSLLEGGVGYLELSEFYGNDVSGAREAVDYFESQGATKMILDLRNNTGGYLDHAISLADIFLADGVVVSAVDRAGVSHSYYSTASETDTDIELVVLVNGMSASASEIVAGALQARDRATIIGTQTYGKGVVQDVYSFNDTGDGFQMTTMQYFTPGGSAVHGIGITPDVAVELDEDYNPAIYEIDLENDNQLEAAVKYLLGD